MLPSEPQDIFLDNSVMLEEAAVRRQAERDGVTHFTTGVAVFSGHKLLVVRRAAHDDLLSGEWELPGGGVDAGETITEGAIRELKEETGLDVKTIVATFPGFDYTTPKKLKARQINFAVEPASLDIHLDPNEHDSHRWIEVTDITRLKTNPVMEQCLRDAFSVHSK